MTARVWVTLAVGVLLLTQAVSRAGIVTPTSSTRLVSATNRETIPTTQQSSTGPAFGAWAGNAVVPNLDFGDPNFNPFGSLLVVSASQQSNFSAAGVTFTGFVFVDYTFGFAPVPGGAATSRSDCTFHVEGPCDFVFQSTFTAYDLSNSHNVVSASAVLRRNTTSETIFSRTFTGDQLGTLTTGDYTLSILIQANSMGAQQYGDARAQIDATFTIPGPSSALIVALFPLLARRSSRPTTRRDQR